MKVSSMDSREDGHNVFLERAEELEKFKSQIRKKRFVSIVAPQHVGKSSLIYNGLIPSLRNKGYMAKAGTSWKIAAFTPEDAPMTELAYALTRPNILYNSEERITPKFEGEVLKLLNSSPNGLNWLYRDFEYVHGYNLIVVVDQFEVIFSPAVSVEERDVFIQLLLNATDQEDYAIYVVIALDSESYERGIAEARHLLDLEAENSPGGDIRRMRSTIDQFEERVISNTFQLHTLNQRLLEAAIKEYALKAGGVVMDEEKCMKLVERLYTVQYQMEQIPKILGEKSWNFWGAGGLKIKAGNKGASGTNRKIELYDKKEEEETSFNIGDASDIVAQAITVYENLDIFQKKTLASVFKVVLFKNVDGEVISRPTELEMITNILPKASYEEIRKVLRIAINTKPLPLFSSRRNELEPDSKLKVANLDIRDWPVLDSWLEDERKLVQVLMTASDDASTYFYNKSVPLWNRQKAKAMLEAVTAREINDKWMLQYLYNPEETIPFLKESMANGPQTSDEPPLIFEEPTAEREENEQVEEQEAPKPKVSPKKAKIKPKAAVKKETIKPKSETETEPSSGTAERQKISIKIKKKE